MPEAASAPRDRIASLDVLRGAVMVLMAIDHVRVFSGLPAGGPTPGIFFTRWITHFCAPVFVFLAGTGAYIHGRKLGHKGALSRFLLTRGLWLVLLELTAIRFFWTFNLDFRHYLLAGVIWAIGWSMVVLAGLIRLPVAAIAAIGGAIVAGHNAVGRLVDYDGAGPFARILYVGGEIGPLVILYVLIPWVGVMALGYAFGVVLGWEDERRRRACLAIGLGAIVLFFALRGPNLYGDPRPWGQPDVPVILSFLGTTKYPASLQFLLMTLGPAIAALPLLARAKGPVARWLTVYGRVPLLYYLLHIPLIHLLAIGVSFVRQGGVDPWLFENHPMRVSPAPGAAVWSLPLLYAVTALAVALLYLPCRRWGDLKRRSSAAWLSYL